MGVSAADMDWMSVAVDVVMLRGYAALVLRVAGRRGVQAVSAAPRDARSGRGRQPAVLIGDVLTHPPRAPA
ncbi:hypothetical protein [Streptomyces sp. NPDC003006]